LPEAFHLREFLAIFAKDLPHRRGWRPADCGTLQPLSSTSGI
jgi:hypothetical protein